MFQYKARIKGTSDIIAEGHGIDEVEGQVLGWRRGQKRGEHTDGNIPVEILHIKRKKLLIGKYKTTVVKVI